jgi:hypothetical protein
MGSWEGEHGLNKRILIECIINRNCSKIKTMQMVVTMIGRCIW